MKTSSTTLEIGLASRSFSNEAKGKEMFASLSRDGTVIAYVPEGREARAMLATLAAAPELLEALEMIASRKTITKSLSALGEPETTITGPAYTHAECIRLAESAIAKATGQA